MDLVDASGRRVGIEKALFRGGEGSIHPVVGRADLLAKIYLGPIDAAKQAKLAAMANTAHEPLLRIAA